MRIHPTTNLFTQEFTEQSLVRFEENTPKIERCVSELTEDELWQRPNASSNSVGNIILHLCGNITQYILSGLGNTEDKRERDKEFTATSILNKEELVKKLKSTVENAARTIRNLKEDEMLRMRSIQGYELSAIGIIIHVVEHYSYHTGQIIFWTKLIKDKDLGFYSNVDLNKKNKI
jgi:uncharacterized damage-inducible protein DinB